MNAISECNLMYAMIEMLKMQRFVSGGSAVGSNDRMNGIVN